MRVCVCVCVSVCVCAGAPVVEVHPSAAGHPHRPRSRFYLLPPPPPPSHFSSELRTDVILHRAMDKVDAASAEMIAVAEAHTTRAAALRRAQFKAYCMYIIATDRAAAVPAVAFSTRTRFATVITDLGRKRAAICIQRVAVDFMHRRVGTAKACAKWKDAKKMVSCLRFQRFLKRRRMRKKVR